MTTNGEGSNRDDWDDFVQADHIPQDADEKDKPKGGPCHYTIGRYEDEAASVAALDALLTACDMFTVVPQETGWYMHQRPQIKPKQPRTDRLLIPKQKLLDMGWRNGVICIECKKSDVKLGKVVAQSMDYSSAVFKPSPMYIQIVPDWLMLWPAYTPFGDIASVMSQRRIGVAFSSYGGLSFLSPTQTLFRWYKDGTVPQIKDLSSHGCRVGSR